MKSFSKSLLVIILVLIFVFSIGSATAAPTMQEGTNLQPEEILATAAKILGWEQYEIIEYGPRDLILTYIRSGYETTFQCDNTLCLHRSYVTNLICGADTCTSICDAGKTELRIRMDGYEITVPSEVYETYHDNGDLDYRSEGISLFGIPAELGTYFDTTFYFNPGITFVESQVLAWSMGNVIFGVDDEVWESERCVPDHPNANAIFYAEAFYSAAIQHGISVNSPDLPAIPEQPIVPEEPISCPNFCEDGFSYYDGFPNEGECTYSTFSCGSAGCNVDNVSCNEVAEGQDIVLRAGINDSQAEDITIKNVKNAGRVYISGTVYGAETEEDMFGVPMPGIPVTIISGANNITVVTNEEGKYNITAEIPNGISEAYEPDIDFHLVKLYDLKIERLDVFQTVEGGAIVANKPGVARIFFGDPNPEFDLSVVVQLLVNGEKYGTPQNYIIKQNYSIEDNIFGLNSANIEIAASAFQQGEVEIGALVMSIEFLKDGKPVKDRSYIDPDLSNNVFSSPPMEVTATRDLRIKYCSVHYRVDDSRVIEVMTKSAEYLRTVYPVGNISVSKLPACKSIWYKTAVIPGVTETELIPEWFVISMVYQIAIDRHIQNSFLPSSEPKYDYTIGVAPDGYLDWDFPLLSNNEVDGISLRVFREDVLVTDNLDAVGHSSAHEIGHHGLGSEEGYIRYPDFGWKIDAPMYIITKPIDQRIIVPGTPNFNLHRYNIMGNTMTFQTWIDSRSWNSLTDFYSLESGEAGVAPFMKLAAPISAGALETKPGYILSGIISNSGEVSIDTQLWLNNLTFDQPQPEDSDYYIQAYSKTNELLTTIPIDVFYLEGNDSPFFVQIPGSPEEISRIEILKKGQPIWEKSASSNLPTVVINPLASQVAGITTISWSVSDLDGDEMTSYLLYSPDNGTTWQTISEGVKGSEYEVDFDELPGCDACQLRVMVTDGWYTVMATSDQTFSVADKSPYVFIDRPLDSEGNPGSYLRGYAYDLEDGELDSNLISWQSEFGDIGDGETVDLTQWTEGEVTFTASIVDSAGNPAEIQFAAQGMQSSEIMTLDENEADADLVVFIFGGTALFMLIVGGVFLFLYFRRKAKGKGTGCVLILTIGFVLACAVSSGIATLVYIDPSILEDEVSSSATYDPMSAVSDEYITEQIGLIYNAVESEVKPSEPADAIPTVIPTVISEIVPDPEQELAFSDDFSVDHGWNNQTNGKFSMGKAVGDVYRMEFYEPGDAATYFSLQPYQFEIPMQDMVVSATATALNENVAFGLVCRYTDMNNFYGFQVHDSGEFWLWKVVAGNGAILFTGKHDEIKVQGKTLILSCQGSNLRAEINGEVIAEVQDFDLLEGNAGFNVQPLAGAADSNGITSSVMFDNFSIELLP